MQKVDAQEVIRRIRKNDNLLNVLIDVEDFFDSLDLYAFENWIEGEIVSGPQISRYWVTLTLKYPYNLMPEPNGGMRLINHDCHVYYGRSYELTETESLVDDGPDRFVWSPEASKRYQPRMVRKRIWLITVEIPRRFIDDISDAVLDQYDVSSDDIEDAEDEGLDNNEPSNEEADAGEPPPMTPPADVPSPISGGPEVAG